MSFRRETGSSVSLDIREIGMSFLTRLQKTTGATFDGLTNEMSQSLSEGRRPDSIRAFVPFGDEYRLKPNLDFVAEWVDAAQETLGAFAPRA
jgi:hypothetical protein